MGNEIEEMRKDGSGWESNPPRLLLQHPSNGFEDRGAHRDSTTPTYEVEYLVLRDPSNAPGQDATAATSHAERKT